jgi:hypothetical protein
MPIVIRLLFTVSSRHLDVRHVGRVSCAQHRRMVLVVVTLQEAPNSSAVLLWVSQSLNRAGQARRARELGSYSQRADRAHTSNTACMLQSTHFWGDAPLAHTTTCHNGPSSRCSKWQRAAHIHTVAGTNTTA